MNVKIASALSALTNSSERKYTNSFRKSVYYPGGLYKVARARESTDLFCISDSVTVVISQKHLDSFAAFNENSQTVQGQIPARQNSRGETETRSSTRQRIRACG